MSILGPTLAQKFIEKTAKNFEYNINIMNDKGIIIASKDPARVGTFHEVAYEMLNGTLDTGVVKECKKYLGTKPGINMFIEYKDRRVGVICVSGDPDTVHAFAGLVKTSMETMLEYELQMESKRFRRDKADQLLYYLLFEENVDLLEVDSWLNELDLKKDLLRVPIIIKHPPEYNYKKLLRVLRHVEGYSSQDIITTARNNDVIIFKVVNSDFTEAIKEYRYTIEKYLKYFLESIPEDYNANKFSFFVGSLQNDISKYRISYSHAQQLALRVKKKEGIYFFNDNILDYYRNIVTIKVYDNIFSIYDSIFNEEDKTMIYETIKSLSENNYNVVNTSKALYIHRNTVLFRLNKIKDALNINPIANAADREFLNELAYYFGNK